MSETQQKIEELKQAVDRHSVCYEVRPEYAIEDGNRPGDGKKVMVGFSLELYGTHDHGFSTLTPGCKRCIETYEDLRRIAKSILPREKRPSRYEISPFDGSLTETPKRHFRPEVELSIKIVHRNHYFDPADACEERCLHEMEQKLQLLGARRGN